MWLALNRSLYKSFKNWVRCEWLSFLSSEFSFYLCCVARSSLRPFPAIGCQLMLL